MSPRTVNEARAAIVCDLDRYWGEEHERLMELLDDLQRAHAHELAERIRAHDWPTGCASGCCVAEPDDAADLIDPYTD